MIMVEHMLRQKSNERRPPYQHTSKLYGMEASQSYDQAAIVVEVPRLRAFSSLKEPRRP